MSEVTPEQPTPDWLNDPDHDQKAAAVVNARNALYDATNRYQEGLISFGELQTAERALDDAIVAMHTNVRTDNVDNS